MGPTKISAMTELDRRGALGTGQKSGLLYGDYDLWCCNSWECWEDAPIHAAMRADEMLDAGDLDGLAVWKRILKAVDELLSEKVPDDATVN